MTIWLNDQGQRLSHYWILIWQTKIDIFLYLFTEDFGRVMQVKMRAVGVRNKREYVIEFICVVERLDLLYYQILADVGGHFCDGSWSISDEPFFLFSRRLLLWSSSQGWIMDGPWWSIFSVQATFPLHLGVYFSLFWNNKFCFIKLPGFLIN